MHAALMNCSWYPNTISHSPSFVFWFETWWLQWALVQEQNVLLFLHELFGIQWTGLWILARKFLQWWIGNQEDGERSWSGRYLFGLITVGQYDEDETHGLSGMCISVYLTGCCWSLHYCKAASETTNLQTLKTALLNVMSLVEKAFQSAASFYFGYVVFKLNFELGVTRVVRSPCRLQLILTF